MNAMSHNFASVALPVYEYSTASLRVQFTRISSNSKTGPIPVTTSSMTTCPTACPFNSANAGGCYAAGGPLAIIWRKVSEGKAGLPSDDFLGAVRKLPKGQLWRHNQAGDLAGIGNAIDASALAELVRANHGRKGFTYTHKPVTGDSEQARANRAAVLSANQGGFAVNLSANDLAHADALADLNCGPVVVVLPADQMTATKTPAGRTVAICPAVLSDSVTCASCGLCQSVTRKAIVGFPAHGSAKRKASAVAMGAA